MVGVKQSVIVILPIAALACGACGTTGGSDGSRSRPAQGHAAQAAPIHKRTTSTTSTAPRRPRVSASRRLGAGWSTVASVGGEPEAWAAQRGGVTLLRFDQRLAHLVLHAGTGEPEASGCPTGCEIATGERANVIAGFNGGFKLSYGSVGFMVGGHVAMPLTPGLGSIVTYQDARTEIGAWHEGALAPGHPAVASVLQNLHLLVDGGAPAANVESCALECWGATLGGGVQVARSALGITAHGQLVWAGGESLSPAELARALVDAGAQRAIELDINPEWVAAYLYERPPGGGLVAAPMVPRQPGIPGQLLAPDARDFFTVVATG